MEKILKFKGKFNINPRLSSNITNNSNYYSEQSGNEEESNKKQSSKHTKHKTSKFIEEEEEEKIHQKPHAATLVIPKTQLKTYDTDVSEPNTPNDNNSKLSSLKKSKFKSLTVKENDQQDMNEISNQLYEVKIFCNFETKNDHFTPLKVEENTHFSFNNTSTAMEIEPEIQNSNENPAQNCSENHMSVENQQASDQDIFKQQEEKLFNRNNLKVVTTNLINKFQQDVTEINSENKIPKKKSKEEEVLSHPFRNLVFSPHCSEIVFKRHLTIIYRGLIYARKCLKGPSENYLKSKQIDLVSRISPQSKTLILDLDETLIHSCSLKENPMHVLKTVGEFGEEIPIGLNVRPYCLEFLQELSSVFEIYVFTASSFSYANAVLKFLDPYNKYISGLLSRSNCMQTKNGFFIKDLRIIRNKNLKDIIIVDNLAHSFGFQIENGVPILEWHSGHDTELFYLKNYLVKAAEFFDVREFNIKNMRLEELASKEPEDLGI